MVCVLGEPSASHQRARWLRFTTQNTCFLKWSWHGPALQYFNAFRAGLRRPHQSSTALVRRRIGTGDFAPHADDGSGPARFQA
eukprot:7306134-Pyramimonas_sp.AAC.1